MDKGCTRIGAAPLVQVQDSSDLTTDDKVLLLEEISYAEDDDKDKGDYLESWGSPGHLFFNSDNNNNNSN